jgi:hypothetical protein
VNTVPDFWPKERVGLPFEEYYKLSDEAKALYNTIYDYCTYSSDPLYQTLHKFRKRIDSFFGRDKALLIEYFNHDPAIRWNGISSDPWHYYSLPY